MKDLTSVLELIRANVSLKDLLISKGRIYGSSPEEQFSCMFHGADRKKSCRYYSDTDTAYCWVCKEKWDIVSFTQKLEQFTFAQTLNYLIKSNRLDVSKLPDTPDAEIARLRTKPEVKIDKRKLSMERMSDVIFAMRNDVPDPTYDKIVYAYMIMKYMVSDEKFQESYGKLKEAILRVLDKKEKPA